LSPVCPDACAATSGATTYTFDSEGDRVAAGSTTYTYDQAARLAAVGTSTYAYGQYTDNESGLVYLRARYYDPATAEFLTVDPAVDTTHSPYAYTDDDPVNLTDPSGLCWTGFGWLCDGAAAVGHAAQATAHAVNRGAQWLNYNAISWFDSVYTDPASLFIPPSAYAVLGYVTQHDYKSAPPGYKGGKHFANDGRDFGQILPEYTNSGHPITYQEWDVNPYVKGQDRGGQRLVTGCDGSAYYTFNHYLSFIRIR
jgi:RHS repeat-associated protein